MRMRVSTTAPSRPPPKALAIHHMPAPTTADAGMVITQAVTMRPATRQRTVAPAHPGAEHGTGGDLRGRQREAEVAGDKDDRRGRRLGGQALRWRDLDQSLAQGADDPPSPEEGAQ